MGEVPLSVARGIWAGRGANISKTFFGGEVISYCAKGSNANRMTCVGMSSCVRRRSIQKALISHEREMETNLQVVLWLVVEEIFLEAKRSCDEGLRMMR